MKVEGKENVDKYHDIPFLLTKVQMFPILFSCIEKCYHH